MAASSPRRRLRLPRRASVAIAVVATLGIAAVVYTRTHMLAFQVSRYINSHALRGSAFEFSCGRIGGNLVQHVVIESPRIRYTGPEGSFDVFAAGRIEVDYRLAGIPRLEFVADRLVMRDVRVYLRRGRRGNLVVPTAFAGRGGAPTARRARARVEKLIVERLGFRFGEAGREVDVRDVNLTGSFSWDGRRAHVAVDGGSAFLSDTRMPVESVRLDAVAEGDAIEIRDAAIRLPRSLVMAGGRMQGGRFERMQIVVNPVSLEELTQLGLVDDAHGEFGGSAVIRGSLDSLAVEATFGGTGMGVALGSMQARGVVRRDAVVLDHIEGEVFGARVSGRFRHAIGGPARFAFEGVVRHVDLTHGFLPDRGIPPTRLDGRLRLEHDAAAGTWDFDADFDPSVVDRYAFAGGSIAGTYREGVGLEVRRVRVERPGYVIEGEGRVLDPDGIFNLVVHGRGDDLTYFWNYFHLPRVDGSVDVTARLDGPADSLRVNLIGDVYGMHYLFTTIDTARVQADVTGAGSATPRARIDVSGRRGTIHGAAVFGPHAVILADSAHVAVPVLSFARGDTVFTARLDVVGDSTRSDVTVLGAQVRTPSETWILAAPAHVRTDAAGDVAVDSMRFVSHAGAVGLVGRWLERDRRIDGWAWGRGVDLRVVRRALAWRIPLEGAAAFRIRALGPLDAPRVEAHARLRRGRVDSVRFDRAEMHARYADGAYRLDRFALHVRSDSLVATGRLEWTRPPTAIVREGPGDDWRDAPLSLTVDAAPWAVDRLQRALHRPVAVSGAFRGRVRLGGTPSRTTLDVSGDLQPRPGPGRMLPPLHVEARVADGDMRLDPVESRGDLRARLAGSIPTEFSLVDGLRIDRSRPADVEVRVSPGALDAVARFVPAVESMTGRVQGRVRLRGPLTDPRLDGSLRVQHARLKLVDYLEVFGDLDAEIVFDGTDVRLEALTARVDGDGRLRARGSATLSGLRPAAWGFDVALDGVRVRSIPDYDGVQDGALRIASTRWPDGRIIPEITGRLEVRRATVHWEFRDVGATPATPLLMPTERPGWVASIDLDAEKNVWIRNPDLRVEVTGNLILKRDEQGLYLRGDLEVLRGWYNVYANKFTITDGTLNFSTVETLRPEVHINAYTPVGSEGGIDKRIYLSLDWPQDRREPTVSLSHDDPGYYETDLWRMLGGASLAGGIAANALERAIAQQMQGLSVEVEQRRLAGAQPGTGGNAEMVIGVGKYLMQDLYLRYRRGLTVAGDQELQVEYRISRMFLLRSEFIRNSRRGFLARTGQYGDEFNFDLKFRWEF